MGRTPHIALILLIALASGPACSQDSVAPYPFEFEDDRDGSGTTADARLDGERLDATRDTKGDGGQETDDFAFPGAPPEATTCDGAWCWLSPTPFGHTVWEMARVGERVFGVATTGKVRGPEAFIWDEGLRFIDFVPPDDATIESMTVSKDGWLALSRAGTVYEFGPDGLRDSTDIPRGAYRRIIGRSADSFVAVRAFDGPVVFRDGSIQELGNSPGRREVLKIWGNGSVWDVTDDRSSPPDGRSNWRTFPAPQVLDLRGGQLIRPALGPSPASDCSDRGIWLSISDRGLARWDEASGRWTLEEAVDRGFRDIACSDEGALFATSYGGKLWRRSNGQWQPQEVAELDLNAVVSFGGTTYIGGDAGSLIRQTDSRTVSVTEGIQPTHPEEPAYGSFTEFADIWVSTDDSRAVIAHAEGLYQKTDQGWEPMPISTGFQPDFDPRYTEIWGDTEPRFALSRNQVLRWDGARWKVSQIGSVLGGKLKGLGMAGDSPENVWVVGENDIYRYDGSDWARITGEGSAVRNYIEDNFVELRDITMGSAGDVLVASDFSIFRITGGPGNWSAQKVSDSPCIDTGAIHQSDDGTLWAAGEDVCVAKYNGDRWTRYQPTFELAPNEDPLDNGIGGNWAIVPRGDAPPLVASSHGILRPTAQTNLRRPYIGVMVDGTTIDRPANATLLLSSDGILANYDSNP